MKVHMLQPMYCTDPQAYMLRPPLEVKMPISRLSVKGTRGVHPTEKVKIDHLMDF